MFSRRFLIIGARANYGSITSMKCFNGLDEVFQNFFCLFLLYLLLKHDCSGRLFWLVYRKRSEKIAYLLGSIAILVRRTAE